ncbi:MAG: hypothetical protein JOZ15_03735 [Acidobacteria bacterium]|nr:hypothetical protein [Acidobacteriota bacterium]
MRFGISYDPARDLATLRAAAARSSTFIAEKRPLAPAPAAPPYVSFFAQLAHAFRQAAVVESRAEIVGRHEQLTKELAAARAASQQASSQLDEGPNLKGNVIAHRLDLERDLARIYEQPAAAWNRLADTVERAGLDKAAHALEHRPAEFGRLHGQGLGRLETKSRREALAVTPGAARELRQLSAAVAAVDAHRDKVDRLTHTIEVSGHRADAIAASLRRLPDLHTLGQDILRAGRALGTAAVHALSAAAVRVFEATTRMLSRALGRHLDHGLGRGDDGLGLGR